MRICLWHGWLLDGTGSNVYTARTAEVLRRAGHDVLLLCQDAHPKRFGFVDAWGTVGTDVSDLIPNETELATGRLVVLRPRIGDLLPVFVYDEYPGFEVKRFVDLHEPELDGYLARNVEALRTAVAWHRSEIVITGHVIPGAVIGRRAVGDGGYVAKIHGSDIEYAVKLQTRYAELAREGLEGARGIVGSSRDVLDRTAAIVPGVRDRMRVAHPGVDVDRFRIRPAAPALEEAAAMLEADPARGRGRPASMAREVRAALDRGDGSTLDALALRYDQNAPDPGAPDVLRALGARIGSSPLVGYLGKLIPQKGVERMIEGLRLVRGATGVVVGFGTHREWLQALAETIADGNPEAYRWLGDHAGLRLELPENLVRTAADDLSIHFTGRLDHRYAPNVLAALDVLAVPSTLAEAFGMVAAEGASAGALPLVARHSGLAEVADALESEVGRPGLFSFEPGDGATRRLADGLQTLLGIPTEERDRMREAVSAFVRREWSWDATARQLLDAATAERRKR